MKPAPFRYHAPRSVAEAVQTLAAVDGKVLAGGQSLVPLLAMRLAAPPNLVDINRITELDRLTVDADGVRIGALARHARVEHDAAVARVQPLLGQALALVAHPTIRNRGTSVGSLAHADPSGELTAVLALTGGSVTASSVRGERVIAAADFFVGPLESALEHDELAVSAFVPALPAGAGSAFVEVARRHGDYALCGVAAVVGPAVDGDESAAGQAVSARLGLISVGEVPLVVDVSAAWAAGDETAVAELVRGAVDPESDIHASADYRRHLAGVLALRALRQADSRRPAAVAA